MHYFVMLIAVALMRYEMNTQDSHFEIDPRP
jgi:hypothetical protein